MTLAPLLSAPLPVQFHVWTALLILPLTAALFTLKRGNRCHRILGWSWVIMMAAIALSSFWIHQIKLVGGYSPIHILSLLVLASLVTGVRAARHRQTPLHQKTMKNLTYGALLGAGLFTLLPDRLMYAILFGG